MNHRSLEHPAENDDDAVPPDSDVDSLLGTRRGFYHLMHHYKIELSQCGSSDALVRQAWPRLAPGMVCAALHGLIHTGYHLSVGSDQGVCEGLAYTHYSYRPVVYDRATGDNQVAEFGKGNRSFLSVLQEIRIDCSMHETMLSDAEIFRAASTRTFGIAQSRLISMCEKQGDRLMGLVHELQLPDFKDHPAIVLGNYLVETAMTAYQASVRRNDFFLLHGVTGAWSLKNILCHLSQEDVIDSARTFLCVLLATYMTQDSPKLEYTVPECDVTQQTWQEIIHKAFGYDYDEHVFKLVQVCHDMWLENRESPQAALYVACAQVALDEPIDYGDYIKIGVTPDDKKWRVH